MTNEQIHEVAQKLRLKQYGWSTRERTVIPALLYLSRILLLPSIFRR